MAYTEGSIQRAWELERNIVKATRKLKTILIPPSINQ